MTWLGWSVNKPCTSGESIVHTFHSPYNNLVSRAFDFICLIPCHIAVMSYTLNFSLL